MLGAAVAALTLVGCDFVAGGDDAPVVPVEPVENSPAPVVADSCGAPIDTNDNGLVEQAEYLSFSGFSFDNWDQNGDGELTPAEFHICWRAMGWGEGNRAFEIFDEDGDGRVGPEDFFGREHFERWDSDGDATITNKEGLAGPMGR